MAHKIALERKFLPAHGDPIRIVPLHVPEALIGIEAAAATAAPRLTYRNGPLIQAVEVFTTFWGVGWNKAPASDLIAQINKFFVDILTSPLIDQLAEYSVPGQQIGHGKFAGTINVTNPTPKTSVTAKSSTCFSTKSWATRRYHSRIRTPFISFMCSPGRESSKVEALRARHSVDTTTTSPGKSSML